MKKQFKVTILVSFISEEFNKESLQPFEGCYSGFCVCVLLDTVCHPVFSCYFGIFKGSFLIHTFNTYFKLIVQAIPTSLTVFPLQMSKSSILWNPIIFVLMNPMVKSSISLSIFHPKVPSFNLWQKVLFIDG